MGLLIYLKYAIIQINTFIYDSLILLDFLKFHKKFNLKKLKF